MEVREPSSRVQSRVMRHAAIASFFTFLAGLSLLAGCESTPSVTPADAPVPVASVVADWNDVEAAVEVGAMRTHLAVLSSQPLQLPDRRRSITFRLLGSDDRQFALTLTQHEPTKSEAVRIDMAAKGVPVRDLRVEEELLNQTGRRLEDLKGREWAPLR